MNKLTNIQIEGNRLTFTVDTDINLSNYSKEIYIDEVCNLSNILCDGPEHNFGIYDGITIDSLNNVVATDDEIMALDWNMKYVTLRCYTEFEEVRIHGIYYNKLIIYNAEIRKLHNYCSTCLDDKTMLNIMLVVFKRQMLDYAIDACQFKEAMQLYSDLCRLLEISTRDYCGDGTCCDNAILTQSSNCLNTEKSKCLHLEKDYRTISKTGISHPCKSTNNCSNGCCGINCKL